MTDHTRRAPLSAARATTPELRIRQKRGQVTYDALIDTAFAMLADKELDEISVAELAQKAGYSVGAFYARFRSKDELFDAMVLRHVQTGARCAVASSHRRTTQRCCTSCSTKPSTTTGAGAASGALL